MAARDAADVMLLILAFFLPPFAVFFKRGCTCDLLINVGLTLLGYLPGMIHAWYLIVKYPRVRRMRIAQPSLMSQDRCSIRKAQPTMPLFPPRRRLQRRRSICI
ncbi:hypothetical protein GGI07_003530 [Coemansia sp. Benny D115]|nr:hypothetical protein GGI07_003530 [Coemansia sp. Benny D115]